jgi:hypothetical protein
MGSGWAGGGADGAGNPGFVMRADHPLAEIQVPSNFAAKYPDKAWDADLHSMLILPQFFALKVNNQSWDQALTVAPPAAVTQAEIDDLLII